MNEDVFHLGIKAIIRDRAGKILLNKKLGKENYWDIPGGRIQRGESPRQALERELREEIGTLKVVSMVPFSMVLSDLRLPIANGNVGLILSVYLCETETSEGVRAAEEGTEISWFDTKEAAKRLTFKYPQEFLEKIAAL